MWTPRGCIHRLALFNPEGQLQLTKFTELSEGTFAHCLCIMLCLQLHYSCTLRAREREKEGANQSCGYLLTQTLKYTLIELHEALIVILIHLHSPNGNLMLDSQCTSTSCITCSLFLFPVCFYFFTLSLSLSLFAWNNTDNTDKCLEAYFRCFNVPSVTLPYLFPSASSVTSSSPACLCLCVCEFIKDAANVPFDFGPLIRVLCTERVRGEMKDPPNSGSSPFSLS